MPHVTIELLAGRTEEQKAAVARAVTEALQAHAGAAPASTSIVFRDVAKENWASGGELMSAKAKG
jgi:4-oxalocrotonate tautomerase